MDTEQDIPTSRKVIMTQYKATVIKQVIYTGDLKRGIPAIGDHTMWTFSTEGLRV